MGTPSMLNGEYPSLRKSLQVLPLSPLTGLRAVRMGLVMRHPPWSEATYLSAQRHCHLQGLRDS